MEKTEKFFKDISRRNADNAEKTELIKEFLYLNRCDIAALCSPFDMANSVKFCDVLLSAMEDMTFDDNVLVKGLTYFITLVNLKEKDCEETFYRTKVSYALRIIENITQKTRICIFSDEGAELLKALRGDYKFMRVLLKYGLIISLPGESDRLRKMTAEIIRNLM